MPTSCQHFAHLQKRFDELARKFVDDQVADELANPTSFSADLDRLAAFRLLIHAELEDFLEEKARERILAIIASISNGSAWIRSYPGLIGMATILEKQLPTPEMANHSDFSTFAKEILLSAQNRISKNNGIKTVSFMFLSLCAGKALDEIDTFLSGSLNSYGKDRGLVAHKSVAHTTCLQAPSAERSSADHLLKGLATYFDVKS